MKIEIKTSDMSIYGTISQEQFEQDVFTFETSDYQFEITNGEDKSIVSNAADGWGNNARFKFKDAEVLFEP